jgi:hypothetical protein
MSAEMDGEAELVVLHRRAGDGLRLGRQSTVHMEIARETVHVSHRQTNHVLVGYRIHARNRGRGSFHRSVHVKLVPGAGTGQLVQEELRWNEGAR